MDQDQPVQLQEHHVDEQLNLLHRVCEHQVKSLRSRPRASARKHLSRKAQEAKGMGQAT